MLCPGCGNEIDAANTCPICENQAAPRRTKRETQAACEEPAAEPTTSFCVECGNTIYGDGACTVCQAAEGPLDQTELCAHCGNEVAKADKCPICHQGRGGGRARRGTRGIPVCINCEEPMEQQDWDGVEVHMCISCQATLFPPRNLEAVLDKLRDATEDLDFEEVLRELRDAHAPRRLSKTIRYRNCPVCDQSMSRLNYGKASGIIVEHCVKHGIWVEQHTFAELSDWISHGGDQLTRRASQRRAYEGPQLGH